jgi:peptidoglycan/LPS O-acetylase OafA/YrhL
MRKTEALDTAYSFKIPALNGIRAVAALLVFVFHSALLEGFVPGGLGVTIFFFLSGYLITTLLRLEYENAGRISLRHFYLRRAYRIWPPMYIVLLLACLPPIGYPGAKLSASAVWAQIANLTNYYMIFGGDEHLIPDTGVMWSLAVEEHFYLIFPLALAGLMRRLSYRQIGAVLGCVCLVVLLWRCYLVTELALPGNYIFFASDTRIDSILFGCIMGICLNPMLDHRCLELSSRTWCWVLGVCAVLIAASEAYTGPFFRSTFRYSVEGLALFPLFFCAVRFHRWPLFRWLDWSWVSGLGLISYTFYLCHLKTLAIAARVFDPHSVSRALCGLLLAIAFSCAMYFLVEKRLARVRRRLHGN